MTISYEYVSLDAATKPRNGECVVDNWWIVHPEKGLAFYKSGKRLSPQCNRSESTAKMLCDRLLGENHGHVVVFVPVVYLGHTEE